MPNKLTRLSGDDNATHAFVFVGGIYSTHDYFDTWEQEVAAPDRQVFGFDHDHTKTSMQVSSKELAQALTALHDEGVTDITVVAHSMGGLVSKGALDHMGANGDTDKFNTIEFHALGTPWGGFYAAEPAHLLPGAAAVSELLGYPMGPDIGPSSDYMQNLTRPLPENVAMHLYQGTDDTVAQPETAATRHQYAAIEALAESSVSITGYAHDDYHHADLSLLDAHLDLPLEQAAPAAPEAPEVTLVADAGMDMGL